MASVDSTGDPYIGLPFIPEVVNEHGYWIFNCPVLGPDGRCGDYENRPATCRSYEPGVDALCVLHHAMG